MNSLEEKIYKNLTPDVAPEDSLNAFILGKAMEIKMQHKQSKIGIVVAVSSGISIIIGVLLFGRILFSSKIM